MLLREPKLKFIRDTGGAPGVELVTSLQFNLYGKIYTVKRGFVSDGMSIPWLFRPLIGDPFELPYVYGAIIHDWHYRTQDVDRSFADAIFRSMLKKSGVPRWKCTAIYLALRAFGWIAWRSNRKKFITKKGNSTMKNTTLLIAALAAIVILAGCSHNVSTYSDGIGFETTFRPDSGNFGLILRYGKIWNFVARENTEAEMSGVNELDAEGNPIASKTEGGVKIKIGTQTTGYEKDIILALKDNPEAIKAFYEAKNKINEKKE